MIVRWFILLTSLVSLATVVAAAQQVHRHRSQPKLLPGVPRAEYQFEARSPSLFAASRAPIMLPGDEVRLDPDTGELLEPGAGYPARVKLFQFDPPRLAIDHCSISDLALRIDERGHWWLSLQADHLADAADGRYNPRLHIRRNELQVRLRVFIAAEGRGGGEASAGRPVVSHLLPLSFFVEQQQPQPVLAAGASAALARDFDLIDQADLEFFYYLGTARHGRAPNR